VARQEITTDKRLKVLLWVIVSAGLAISLEAFAQHYLRRGILLPWVNQPIGTIGNTNYVGCYLLFPIFAALGLRRERWFVPLFVFCLFISRARASWLGFGIGFGLWLYWTVPRKVFVATSLLCILGAIAAFMWFPNGAKGWAETNTLRYRFKYWQASVELWKESPLFGTGMASYRNRVYDAQGRLGQRDPSYWNGYDEPKPRHVHNDYLESLNDGGLLYAVTFWGFIGYVMLRVYRKGLDRMTRAIFCGQVAVLVSAMFFFPFRLTDTAVLFFVQSGVLCSPESR